MRQTLFSSDGPKSRELTQRNVGNSVFLITLIISVFFLSSCLKEEFPIPKKDLGGLQADQVEMGNGYENQVFYDLSTHKITGKNSKYIWDIAFENGTNGKHIIINNGKNMRVFTTQETVLDNVMNKNVPTSQIRTYDHPTQNMDSTGFGNWEDGKVRIFDLGYNSNGAQLGWYKMKMTAVTPTTYTFKFAEITASQAQEVTIEKKDKNDYNFVYFSLVNSQQVEVAPKNDNWDIEFAQYLQLLYDDDTGDFLEYLITGALINHFNGTKALKISETDFEDIDADFVASSMLSDAYNAIGYEWKDYNFDTGEYDIYPNISYIVKDHNGSFYKIRFVDFYNKLGEKGTPVFEYEALK